MISNIELSEGGELSEQWHLGTAYISPTRKRDAMLQRVLRVLAGFDWPRGATIATRSYTMQTLQVPKPGRNPKYSEACIRQPWTQSC